MKTQASASRNKGRKLLSARDIVFSAAVIVIALAAYFLMQGKGSGGTAVVSFEGEAVAEIPLDRDGVYPLEGFDMELTVKNGEICVSKSDCPDKICEKTGFISGTGQSIVCLPNRISVRIISNTENEIDVVLN